MLGNGAAGLTQYAVILVAAGVGFAAQGYLARSLLGEPTGALDVSGNPDADTALVAIGTIGESAQELLEARA